MAETLRYIHGHYFGSGEMFATEGLVPRARAADGAASDVEAHGDGRGGGEPGARGERASGRGRRPRDGR
jgi:hypothetical protein